MEKRIFNRERPSGENFRRERPAGERSAGGRTGGARRFGGERPSGFGGGDRPNFRRSDDSGREGPRRFGGGDRPNFRRPERSGSGFRGDFQSNRENREREPSIISIELINGGKAPQYMSREASGMDIYANSTFTINSKEKASITTGILINSIPPKIAISVRSRSSLAKDGLLLLSPTLLSRDDLKKELTLTFYNISEDNILIEEGNRIGQFVITSTERITMEVSEVLSETERNEEGLGSTGK